MDAADDDLNNSDLPPEPTGDRGAYQFLCEVVSLPDSHAS